MNERRNEVEFGLGTDSAGEGSLERSGGERSPAAGPVAGVEPGMPPVVASGGVADASDSLAAQHESHRPHVTGDVSLEVMAS